MKTPLLTDAERSERAFRRELLLTNTLHVLAAAAVGLVGGIILGLGYIADAPAWMR